MPEPIYKTVPAKSKIAKSKDGIIVTQVGGATVIRIKPAVGMLGENPAIVTDLMTAVDNVLHHWKK
jgi:hypothetical protein